MDKLEKKLKESVNTMSTEALQGSIESIKDNLGKMIEEQKKATFAKLEMQGQKQVIVNTKVDAME